MTSTPKRLHSDALESLRTWTPPTDDQAVLRDKYVAHLEAHPDGLRRTCFPDHITASTLVMSSDGSQALLTLHAKARAWFQLGGHCEAEDRTLAGVALREATEESGIDGLRLDPVPVQLSAHAVPFCDPRGGVHHLDVRYAAQAPPNAAHQITDESLALRWWPLEALPTGDDDILELVNLASARRQSGSASWPGGGSSRAPAE